MKRGGSNIDSPKWLKNKKATINPYNNDDNCFQYDLTVALNHQNIKNILFVPHNTEEIRLAYKLTHSFKTKNQVIVLMITDGKNWHYLVVKRVPALPRGVTSNHNGDFYCLNCSQSYSTKNKLKEHERV